MTGTSLNAARRSRELAALAGGETVDLLVVGLGVTGAGVALDAAARGLSVAAVDAHDLAFGGTWPAATSPWRTKAPPNAMSSFGAPPRTWSARCRSCCR
jgi:glycine/D-amino acid oxidase-like deaminating enzyme